MQPRPIRLHTIAAVFLVPEVRSVKGVTHQFQSIDASASSRMLERLLEDVEVAQPDAEPSPRVTEILFRRLRQAGICRLAVPTPFGGNGETLVEALHLIERISSTDASVGWMVALALQSANCFCALPPRSRKSLYRDGPDVFGVACFPPRRQVRRTPGGLMVDGRWPLVGPAPSARWVILGARVDEEGDSNTVSRVLVMSSDEIELVEAAPGIGLQAAGAWDVCVRDRLVDEQWSFDCNEAPHMADDAIGRFPCAALTTVSAAAVGVGAARAALDALIALAAGKISITGGARLGERGFVQSGIAKADAQLRMARDFLYGQAEKAWGAVVAGDELSEKAVVFLGFAAIEASRAAVEAARAAFSLAGTTAIFLDHPIQRHLRDVVAVHQHARLNGAQYENAGKLLLGDELPRGFR